MGYKMETFLIASNRNRRKSQENLKKAFFTLPNLRIANKNHEKYSKSQCCMQFFI